MRLERHGRGDAPIPTARNEESRARPAPNNSVSRRDEAAALLTAARVREQPLAPRRWWKSMNRSSRPAVHESLESDLADALGAADLAPELMARLLPRVPSWSSHAAPAGVTTGQTSSARCCRPATAISGARRHVERDRASPRRRRRRSTSPRPRARVSPWPEVVRRAAARREVLGRAEQRRVVRVVRGPEEHGLGVGRHRGQGTSPPGGGCWSAARESARLHLVAVHERDDAHEAATPGAGRPRRRPTSPRGRLRRRRPTTPVERPAREGSRPRVPVNEGVPLRRLDRVERTALSPQCGEGHRRGRGPMAGRHSDSPVNEERDTLASIAPAP